MKILNFDYLRPLLAMLEQSDKIIEDIMRELAEQDNSDEVWTDEVKDRRDKLNQQLQVEQHLYDSLLKQMQDCIN